MNIVKSSTQLVMAMSIAILLLTAGCAATTTPGASSAAKTTATKTTTAVRQLDWTPPVAREDGSALPMPAIAGYKIYYGDSSGKYTASVNINSPVDVSGVPVSDFSLASFSSGTYYFVMTTLDVGGRESPYSNEVKVTL